jgi:hypothetical protein
MLQIRDSCQHETRTYFIWTADYRQVVDALSAVDEDALDIGGRRWTGHKNAVASSNARGLDRRDAGCNANPADPAIVPALRQTIPALLRA